MKFRLAFLLPVAAAVMCLLASPSATAADSAEDTTEPGAGGVVLETLTATYQGSSGDQARSLAAAAAAVITCTVSYDYPHPSSDSQYTTVNAHLTVRCTAPVTSITLTSTMCTANLSRCGSHDTKLAFGKSYAMTGGDAACGPNWRWYQAHGSVFVGFPPGYTPTSASSSPLSALSPTQIKKNANGKCVKR